MDVCQLPILTHNFNADMEYTYFVVIPLNNWTS